jgi:hypothetical protein
MKFLKEAIGGLAIAITLVACIYAAADAQIAWEKTLNGALQRAAKENKFIVLDISASW